jgi:hypothetical protein
MYFLNLSTFEDNLNAHNDFIMQRIQTSEMDSVTSTVRNKCVFKYSKNDGSIKQYRNDKLVSISTHDSYTLVKTPYPGSVNQIYTPNGFYFNDKFKTESVIVFAHKDTDTHKTLIEKTYLAENLRFSDMTWDTSGNLLTPVAFKWVHSIINLKYVNSWIKNNVPELVDMRSNNKKLKGATASNNTVAYTTDVQAYLDNTITDIALTRLLDTPDFKKIIAQYLKYANDENAYINTYFDTYEELEQYKSSRLGKNK